MKRMIILAVLLCGMAQADITVMVGENYAGVDLGKRIYNGLEIGGSVAVDYFTDQSQPLKNFHVTTGDTYIGAYAKLHLAPEAWKLDPYIGIRALSQDLKLKGSGAYEVYEAGVNVFLKGNLGLGFVYQRCERMRDKDKFLVAVPWKF